MHCAIEIEIICAFHPWCCTTDTVLFRSHSIIYKVCVTNVFCLQLSDKTERVFNASSTLTPDSMMSDESQSRDWQLAEQVPGITSSNMADGPQLATETTVTADVRQFSSVSNEVMESSLHDKYDYSGVTESPQLHDQCMLSGIDVSSVTSDSNVSARSVDVSVDAELNDARLSAADGDSSVNSTLKGSDTDEPSSKHSGSEINSLQPTFSVSIPISNVFEIETKKDENAVVQTTAIESSGVPVGEGYSPISDAGEETTTCQTPVRTTPPVNSRATVRAFSPISPFTPRPTAPNTTLPVVPLNWPCDASAAAVGGMRVWSTGASPAESAGMWKTQQHCGDVVMSTSAVSSASNFTFMHRLSYLSQSRPSSRNSLTEVNAPLGHCQNVSFEQQHTGAIPQHGYRQPARQYPGPALPHQWYHSQSQQPYMQYANIADGSTSTHSSYSANIQRQNVARLGSVETGRYTVTVPTASVQDTDSESEKFDLSSHSEVRLAQEVSGVDQLPSVTSRVCVSDSDRFDRLQLRRHCSAVNTSISNNGWFVCLFSSVAVY